MLRYFVEAAKLERLSLGEPETVQRQEVTGKGGGPLHFSVEEAVAAARELDRELSIHLYRVTQEALNNVARHSNSKCAAVRLRYLAEAVVLEIEDEGIGFQNKDSHGLGLVSMRERAGLVNGTIQFSSGEAKGVLVRVTVPLTAERAHA